MVMRKTAAKLQPDRHYGPCATQGVKAERYLLTFTITVPLVNGSAPRNLTCDSRLRVTIIRHLDTSVELRE